MNGKLFLYVMMKRQATHANDRVLMNCTKKTDKRNENYAGTLRTGAAKTELDIVSDLSFIVTFHAYLIAANCSGKTGVAPDLEEKKNHK